MPRLKKPPTYRRHKARNLAVVTIGGRDIYLGPYGSPESHEKYARLIAELPRDACAAPKTPTDRRATTSSRTVNEVIFAYLEHAETYYRKHEQVTGEFNNIRAALRPLKRLYGFTPAEDFGVAQLMLVRQSMLDDDLARRTINGRISRIKRMFRWAASCDLVAASVFHSLQSLDGLRMGRSKARETQPVQIVSEDHVAKAREKLCPHVRAMVLIQELAGMRPQDIRNLRRCDLDCAADVWIYRPWTHKTEHHGQIRSIAIGPRAQEVLAPFLSGVELGEYVFQPLRAKAEQRRLARAKRKTPLTPSQRRRKAKADPKRAPGTQYSKDSYARAIRRACETARIPLWHPHQLRHNCATKVRKLFGLEAAAAVLGHRFGIVTEIYAERDLKTAIDVMREIG